MRQISKYLGRAALALVALAAVATAATAALTTAEAGGKKTKSEAKLSVKADKPSPDGKQKIVVTMEVNPGWYAYANPVGLEDFKNNATVIKVIGNAKVQNVAITYPPGKLKKDAIVGDYHIYEGKVEIPMTLQRVKGDTGSLELSVRFMTCNVKGLCLAPETVKLTVP